MPWGNELHMRPIIAKRRADNIKMREVDGATWQEIADALEYGSLHHACVDYRRAKKALQAAEKEFNNKKGRGPITSRAHITARKDKCDD